ncbi:glycoside hydrolase family 78 protein [Dothidotthia symphoricarpi CBS 119687]|uniref:alpha-L-rhamnosidase n=1 Tax=Dothidotthia symphoricarpi CBS 119687 TaxID=1392245 RepID=A0A6A6A426_9PLEO|nr:glycoside hydrolase family 78 protein [Dothidotthia symphoricarpi CBS 119687]KAF2125667.1 glycoside hydrolase family 78 protein [Dothidotthia symphoricarpi CBS 119687]
MAFSITRCGIHAFHEVLGIDSDKIRFFWVLHSDREDAQQTAYRVKVSLSQGGFHSATFHYWQVTVWDQDGQETTSESNEFFTAYPRCSGLLPPYSMNQTYMPHTSLIFRTWFEDEPNRWKGVWIGDNGDKPLYLRKSIHLERKPSRAIVFASGLGHFNFVCNGDPAAANGHVLDPGWTNYHRTVQFVAYDISNILKAGENVIGAHVGNGFYAGDQGDDRFFWPSYEDNTYVRYGNELCFFAEVHLFYDDGSRECITTGPDWSIRKSATTLANIYSSETKDLRNYPTGWDTPSYEQGAEWKNATPVTGPRGKLKYQNQPPVVLHETFEPKTKKTLEPGIVSFDFGQNMTTMVKIQVSGPAGSEVIMRFSETIGEDGKVLMPDPLFKQFEYGVFCKFTLAGTGVETWEPDFCFTSARYIQIEGASFKSDQGLPVVHSVVSRHVSSAARRLGSMKTDKEDVNKLIDMCYWSFVSNLFSYHTDCPQMEKFGWLEVTHLLAPATQYIRDMESLYSKILDDIVDAQEPNGLCPTMAPEIRYMCGPLHDTITWGGAVALLPEILRFYYDSTHVFEKLFDPCVRYMEYIRTKERDGGLIEHGLGDWGRDIAFGNNQANIETAIYYRCLRNIERMAHELDKPEAETRFREWANRIYTVYNARLLVTDKKLHPYAFYTSRDEPGTQDRNMVAQAFALQFDLVPAQHIPDIQRAFLADCAAAQNRIQAGEIGLKYLWNTLADVDRPDIVLEMARQEEHPSYMRFIRRGETTLNEFWQDACRSKCHDMLGTIYEWFYEAVLGVKPESEAYRTWTVRPPLRSEFGRVEGSVECPYGVIEVVYEKKGEVVKMKITVPTSTTGFLLLPGDDSEVAVTRRGGDTVTKKGRRVSLKPGRYELELKP